VRAAELEQQALSQLRVGDLVGAHRSLVALLHHRPDDRALSRRIQQVEALLQQRKVPEPAVSASEPLTQAYQCIRDGHLAQGLRLLRVAIERDPSNERLRQLALEVARRLQSQGLAAAVPRMPTPPVPAADPVPAAWSAKSPQPITEPTLPSAAPVLAPTAVPARAPAQNPVNLGKPVETRVRVAHPEPRTPRSRVALLETLLLRISQRRRLASQTN
jgi:hypothetical protein